MAATRQGRGKRYLLDSAWVVKLFARLTKLSWSDVRDICVISRHCLLAQKKRKKITEYRDTAPFNSTSIKYHTLPKVAKQTFSSNYYPSNIRPSETVCTRSVALLYIVHNFERLAWRDALTLVPQVLVCSIQAGHKFLCSACHRSSTALHDDPTGQNSQLATACS